MREGIGARIFRRMVIPNSRQDNLTGTIRTGSVMGTRTQIAPLNRIIPKAVEKPRGITAMVYDGKHYESNDYETARTWMLMARGDLISGRFNDGVGIPCSTIARYGPGGTLGFIAYCDEADVAVVKKVLEFRRLFPYSLKVERTAPPQEHAVE